MSAIQIDERHKLAASSDLFALSMMSRFKAHGLGIKLEAHKFISFVLAQLPVISSIGSASVELTFCTSYHPQIATKSDENILITSQRSKLASITSLRDRLRLNHNWTESRTEPTHGIASIAIELSAACLDASTEEEK